MPSPVNKINYAKNKITVKSGGTVVCDSGSTVTFSGTVTGVSIAAPASLAVTGAATVGTTLKAHGIVSFGTSGTEEFTVGATGATRINAAFQVNGISSFGTNASPETTISAAGVLRVNTTSEFNGISSHGTHALPETTISAVGAYASTADMSFSTNKLVITGATGVVTLHGTSVIDANTLPGTLAITETAIHLTGATTNTGALTVTGAFNVGTAKFAVAAATGILTLGNSMVIDGNTKSDAMYVGALVGICNDNSPTDTIPANGVCMYWSGTDLIVKRQSDGKIANMTTYASWT